MQFRTTKKLIIDEQKLNILIRLGCPDDKLLSVIKTGKFDKTGDKIIDEILECFVDRKEFKNWGGNHNPKGINNCNKKKKRGQVDQQVVSQDGGQVVDKDIDKEKIKIKYNHYGELNNVCLTEEDYNKLLSLHPDLNLAIEKLDGWLDTKNGEKNKNRNHRCYFKSGSWVWEVKENNKKIEPSVLIEEGKFYIDPDTEEYKDLFYDITEKQQLANKVWEWVIKKFEHQEIKISFIREIIKKFKNGD